MRRKELGDAHAHPRPAQLARPARIRDPAHARHVARADPVHIFTANYARRY